MEINRYLDSAYVHTQLDPIADVTSWIRGLRSIGYTRDILRTVHGFSDKYKIEKSSHAIAAYVDTAIQLLDQSQSSSIELSYLPTYYAMLNLAKAVSIFGGYLDELSTKNNKFHGAKMGNRVKKSQSLLTGEIILQTGGAIPLYYQTLVGKPWYRTKGQRRVIKLREIYPYIMDIQFEFNEVYKLSTGLHGIYCNIEDLDNTRAFRLVLGIKDLSQSNVIAVDKRNYKILSGLQLENNIYVSKKVTANSREEGIKRLYDKFPHFLLYLHSRNLTLTPQSKSNLMLPEEIPILFAYFHLSNIVRYDPITLKRLFDSKAIGVLEALARHAKLKYLLLFWAYVNELIQTFRASK